MSQEQHIYGYHAHIYFDADSVDNAEQLALKAGEQLPVSVGRLHQRNVGPHPSWSCQLAFKPEAANQVIPWLAQHRGDLTVFFHLISGDDYTDHTQNTFWMGSIQELNLDFFKDLSEH